MSKMDTYQEFNSETIKLFCSDYGLNPNSFDWKNFSEASLFPSQGIDDFKESWLNHAIADLANMNKEQQNIMFNLVNLASEHFYNLLEILLILYPPVVSMDEIIEEASDETGVFMIFQAFSEPVIEAWMSNRKSNSQYNLDINLEIILKSTKLTKADERVYAGKYSDEFFKQFKQNKMLISKSDMNQIVREWYEKCREILVNPHRLADISLTKKQDLVEYIKRERMKIFDEIWMNTADDEGNQLLKDMLSAVKTDDSEEFDGAISSMNGAFGDTGFSVYTLILASRLDDLNEQIRKRAMRGIWISSDDIPVGDLVDILSEKLLAFGQNHREFIYMIEEILRSTIPQELEWILHLTLTRYSENCDSKYTDEILKQVFLPGEIQRKNHEILSDIYNLRDKHLNDIIPRWNKILKTHLNWIFENGSQEEKCNAADLLSDGEIPGVEDIIKHVEANETPLVKYWLGLPNKQGYTRKTMYQEFSNQADLLNKILRDLKH
jgi:hypothetical protein